MILVLAVVAVLVTVVTLARPVSRTLAIVIADERKPTVWMRADILLVVLLANFHLVDKGLMHGKILRASVLRVDLKVEPFVAF